MNNKPYKLIGIQPPLPFTGGVTVKILRVGNRTIRVKEKSKKMRIKTFKGVKI